MSQNPQMTPYDPLHTAPEQSQQMPQTQMPYMQQQQQPYPMRQMRPLPAKKQTIYRFESFPLHLRLIGVFLILPLYFYLIPDILLVYPARMIAGVLPFPSDDAMITFYNLLFEGVMWILLIILLHNVLIQSFRDMKEKKLANFAIWTVLGYAGFFAVNIAAGLIETALTSGTAQNQEAVTSMTSFSPLAMYIMAALMAPVTEELIFRGIIFRTIRPLGKIPAILISGLAFGFLHVMDYVFAGDFAEMVYIITYFAMGLSLGIIYEKRRNLLQCIVIHGIQNSLAMLILTLTSSL